MKKVFFFSFVILAVLILVGAGCGKIKNSKLSGGVDKDFFTKHCEYIFRVKPDMLTGWANNKEECIRNFISNEEQAGGLCSSTTMDCDAAQEKRLNTYRETVTKQGCLKIQKGMKCSIWDTEGNYQWANAPADQKANAKVEFVKCLAEAESYCSVFDEEAPY